ncbi:MAG: glycosyltransferase [Pseudanabaenaceae cyanobacterium SKYGB_i_bin29]|nr:glycosyltransferase [Pseudanabaenaceae cyanobacterium SKYG29]MDW8422256.1 glycosyltransferase [Pseudanabaenaceae cyanobacterium SKYGB_i_bin29]
MKITPEFNPRCQLSLVVPTYNERENLPVLVSALVEILAEVIPDRFEIIIVDDDSPDGTWELAQSLQSNYQQLQVVRRTRERGLATAVICGWQMAQGEILGVIDGDLQHPPATLKNMWAAITEGADLVVASRYTRGGSVGSWNSIRQFLSRGAVNLALWILPEIAGCLSDPMSGYFLVKRSAIADCELSPIGYKILLEVMARGQIDQVKEVPYTFRERREGSSKVTWRQYEQYIRHLLSLRFAVGRGKVAPLGRFLRFAVVGLSGVVVDFFVLAICSRIFGFSLLATKTELANLPILLSKILAVEIAIINNFIGNEFWTFRDTTIGKTSPKQRLQRFGAFNLACTIGAVINVATFLFFAKLGVVIGVANLLAIGVSTAWNYVINLKFNWRSDG